ncbi:MAG: heat-inducible transcriptional repressor HrcA [Dehalococcoidales bacterium]|nr:heat-inducible transcriptional repressor HrcA [Dehalococcoidales bacterium]
MNNRTATILGSITRQYISRAAPVSSASVVVDCGLDISSATIRNEMVMLENAGYIIRPHHAAGSIPSDKGYRFYVENLNYVDLPIEEQRLISHLFHQVEENLEQWLSLAVTLLSQRVQNIAIMTSPKPPSCRFKHMELVSLQEQLALAVLVLRGAVVRQQLVNFEQPVTQEELRIIADKMVKNCTGLSAFQISNKTMKIPPNEQRVVDCIVKLMRTEDGRSNEDSYVDGLHYLMNQPEFNTGNRMVGLMGLVEQRKLIEAMMDNQLNEYGVQVIIGKENRAESIQNFSVVLSRYGIPDEAIGTIGVVGPTRMHYARTISAISFISSMMSKLISDLYGRETHNNRKKMQNN